MPSNPDSQFAFRDAELAAIYDSSFGRSHRHEAAKARLKRWELARQELLAGVVLGLEEAQILHYLLSSGSKRYSEDSLESMQINLELLRRSTIDGLEDYARTIDVPVLAAKIKGWSTAQWYAVLDACDRVGGGSYHIENLPAALKEVGF